jgi:hypothetical protein
LQLRFPLQRLIRRSSMKRFLKRKQKSFKQGA